MQQGNRHRAVLAAAVAAAMTSPLAAQVNVTANTNSILGVVPPNAFGIHTSVYDNNLQNTNQLDSMLDAAGISTLRYPGGGYADIFHFSVSRQSYQGGLAGHGFSPWWGQEGNYGWMGANADFGNFVKLLDATQSQTVITLNTGAAMKYLNANQLGVPDYGGQAKEAAAWVAYANADASLFGTPNDIALGVDQQGNDWKTAGYWAKLRASTTAQYQSWASAAGVYDSRNAFLAIDRDAPVGIKYWEVGNETFGTGYYGGGNGYALDYGVAYDGTVRTYHPDLSPAAYGQQVNEYASLMKSIDPDIKIGAVLATPPDDYSWSYKDNNGDGNWDSGEPFWNDEVLAQCAEDIDFAIVHWYPGGNSTQMLSYPRTKIPLMINGTTAGLDTGPNAGLRDSLDFHRADDGRGVEIFVTETDGGGSSETVDGLFAADEYATFFEHGVSNVDWLELHNGGFLNDSNTPNFAYWGIQMVHLMEDVGDEMVSATSSSNSMRAHVALQEDGDVAVMLLNTSTNPATVNVNIAGELLNGDAIRYSTNGDTTISQTSVTGLGSGFSVSVPGRNVYTYILSPPTWAQNGDGSWSTGSNWVNGLVPNGIDNTARFGAASLSASVMTVTVDGAKTVGAMRFNSGSTSYTISGSSITLDKSSGNALINVLAGNHTIASPLVLNDDLYLNVIPAGSTLAITGAVTATGRTINKTGDGTAQFENVRAAALNIDGGMVRISPKSAANDPAGTSIVNSLAIAGSVLDLTNNSMVIDYTGSPGTLENDIRQLLLAGSITSSAAAGGTKLGYADNAVIDADSLLIKFTFAGDVNLDGQVTISDLGDMASNWQSTAAVWQDGDFNYDGQVTISDLGDLASNWQAGVGSPLGMSFNEALAAVGLGGANVPEPAAVGVLVGMALAARRRLRLRGLDVKAPLK